MASVNNSETSVIDFHRGEVLYSLAATYPSLLLTVLECIQNALDVDATRVLVGIDLACRNVVVMDNGFGVTKERFDKALASVGHGVKDETSLGRFGRGLVSPLDKCEQFIFASVPAGEHAARQWMFRGCEIRKQHLVLSVPCVRRPSGLPQLPAVLTNVATDTFDVKWHTMVYMKKVTQSKVISLVDLDEMEAKVRSRFSLAMLEKKSSIRILLIDTNGRRQIRDINPVDYLGEPLPEVTYTDPVCGEVVFRLFRSPRKSKSVRVDIAQQGRPQDRVDISAFSRQAAVSQWREIVQPALAALSSGYFEGTVFCKNIELHPNRNKFVYDDSVETLYDIITRWYEEHGKSYYEDEHQLTRDERYQRLGIESQRKLGEVFRQPVYSRFWDVFLSVVAHGRLGQGHADPARARLDGVDTNTSRRTGQGGTGTTRVPPETDSPSRSREKPQQDRPGDIPTGVIGSHGQRRRLVKGDSQGLWFDYARMEGSSLLWQFDFDSGVLMFNVRHPIWVELDETKGRSLKRNDLWIMKLQEWLAFEMLCLLALYPSSEEFEEHRHQLDTRIRPYVELFIKPQH